MRHREEDWEGEKESRKRDRNEPLISGLHSEFGRMIKLASKVKIKGKVRKVSWYGGGHV